MGAPVDLFHDPKVGESFSKSAGGACWSLDDGWLAATPNPKTNEWLAGKFQPWIYEGVWIVLKMGDFHNVMLVNSGCNFVKFFFI